MEPSEGVVVMLKFMDTCPWSTMVLDFWCGERKAVVHLLLATTASFRFGRYGDDDKTA
jgi:hypothetical protein